MHDFNRRVMDWNAFVTTPEYLHLGKQQSLFVQTYCETGDPVVAMSTAYSVNDAESARTSAYAVLRRKHVKAALDRYMLKTPQELLVEDAERIARSRKATPATKMAVIKLKAQLLGLKVDDEETPSKPMKNTKTPEPKEYDPNHVYRVDELFIYENQVVRATEVKNGVPTKADPVVEVGA